MEEVRVMRCRSGDGLMAYGYSFIQVGGFKGQTNDNVISTETFDGKFTWGGHISNVDIILDCRDDECKPITIDQLQQIHQKQN